MPPEDFEFYIILESMGFDQRSFTFSNKLPFNNSEGPGYNGKEFQLSLATRVLNCDPDLHAIAYEFGKPRDNFCEVLRKKAFEIVENKQTSKENPISLEGVK